MNENGDRFKGDVKDMIDKLFEAKFFKDSITRDNLNTIENYLEWSLNCKFNSHIKLLELQKMIKELDKN